MAKVFILTWCSSEDSFYGNSMVFPSLRVGFPDADIAVVDNNSSVGASRIKELALSKGAKFVQLDKRISHEEFVENAFLSSSDSEEPVIFLDPDVVFWKSMEFKFDKAIEGRFIPEFRCPMSGAVCRPRLHTSLLGISNPKKLNETIEGIRSEVIDYHPFYPWSSRDYSGTWIRWDATASLYSSLFPDIRKFDNDQLDSYDHIFCGTHTDEYKNRLEPDIRSRLSEVHNVVKNGETENLRGLWREQEEMFQSRVPTVTR